VIRSSIRKPSSFVEPGGRGAQRIVGIVLLLAVAASACGKPAKPAPDGVSIELTNRTSRLQDVISDDRQQSWFLLVPGFQSPPAPAIVCRMFTGALTCGIVPGTEVQNDDRSSVRLLEPGPGASPVVMVRHAGGTRVIEPLTWRLVRSFDHDVTGFDQGLVWADGTILLRDSRDIAIARPHEGLHVAGWFGDRSLADLHLSRWGVVWVEYGAADEKTLRAATFDDTGLAAERSLGKADPWIQACRDGSTFGFVELHSKQLVMLDLTSGAVQRGSAGDGFWKAHCRPGSVAAIAPDLRNQASAICDARGCRTFYTRPEIERLNYHQLALVDGALMLVSTKMEESRIMTWRLGEAPRMLKLAGDDVYQDAQLEPVASGAIAMYLDGFFLAFDHRGGLQPITLTWVGEPAVKPTGR
jgi:hypothetical protein